MIRLVGYTLLLLLFACDESGAKKLIRPPDDAPPNVILIIADDLGYGSIGAFGNKKFHTPHLDYLANNGLKFDQFYVSSPVCSPSRASILTGQPGTINGVNSVLKPSAGTGQLSKDVKLISEQLQEQDYETALFGKWHLGYDEANHPLNRGFDHFKGFISGHVDYISHVSSDGHWPLMNDFKQWRNTGQHLTTLLTEEAISFLEDDRRAPYFIVLSYANPHRPIILPGETAAFPGKANRSLDTPERYQQLVELLDMQIGEITAKLSQLNDNTIVIFLSDHGSPEAYQGNNPLKGGKGMLYEGGIKVPAFVYWKQQIQAQKTSDFVHTLDLYPSILHLAEIEEVRGPGRPLIDQSGQYLSPENQTCIWSFGGVKAIRKNNWKAIFIPSEQRKSANRYLSSPLSNELLNLVEQFDMSIPLLFELHDDPFENNNISISHPGILDTLWTAIKTDSIGLKL